MESRVSIEHKRFRVCVNGAVLHWHRANRSVTRLYWKLNKNLLRLMMSQPSKPDSRGRSRPRRTKPKSRQSAPRLQT